MKKKMLTQYSFNLIILSKETISHIWEVVTCNFSVFNLFLLIGPYLSQQFHTQRQADQVKYHPVTDTIHLGSYVLIKLILNYFKQLWIRGCKCGTGPTFLGGRPWMFQPCLKYIKLNTPHGQKCWAIPLNQSHCHRFIKLRCLVMHASFKHLIRVGCSKEITEISSLLEIPRSLVNGIISKWKCLWTKETQLQHCAKLQSNVTECAKVTSVLLNH